MSGTGQQRIGPVSHQTVQLGRGRHASPEHGACVVELASMLAGEPFSDHPLSVCPVIAALLRSYNDRVDDSRRQHLYPYAAKIVGTRGPGHVERSRRRYLSACVPQPPRRRWRLPFGSAECPLDTLAARAVDHLCSCADETDTLVFELVDRLLALGSSEGPGVTDAFLLIPAR